MIGRSLVALGVLLSTGMAAPTPPPAPSVPPPLVGAAGESAKKITLITGDVVTYSTAPDGSPQAQIQPARRRTARRCSSCRYASPPRTTSTPRT